MIGILGGGQLATFLIEAAHHLGKKVRVLVTRAAEPAALLADEVVIDDGSRARVAVFLDGIDLLLFESENVDLSRIEAVIGKETRVVPSFDAIRTLQDKAKQKDLLRKLDLPTAAFRRLPRASSDPGTALSALDQEFPTGWILKRSRGGYDGRGNWMGADKAEALAWISRDDSEVYAEARVSIARELAVVLTRTAQGEIRPYPAIFTTQRDGICDFAEGPATSLGLSPEDEKKLVAIASRIAEGVDYVGTLAVEFFQTSTPGAAASAGATGRSGGEFFVNEIAPRVHNSGHFTLDGARTSQFEQHLRAALGLPLGPIETTEYFRMQNLLGPKGAASVRAEAFPTRKTSGRVIYYDYGKDAIREGRKLGHLTIVGRRDEKAECTDEIAKAHRRWLEDIE